MQKVLWKKSKRIIMLLLGAVLLLAGILGVISSRPPSIESSEKTLFSYTVTADSDYLVLIEESPLYDTTTLKSGAAYPAKLTKEFEFTFFTDFIGSEEVDVEGSYTIKAIVEGLYSGSAGRMVVYRKEFPLAEGTLNGEAARRGEKSETVTIDPHVYREFTIEADSLLEFSVGNEMMVEFSGTYIFHTPHGDKQEDFTYTRVLPILKGTELYEIAPVDKLSQEKSITETEEIEVPASNGKAFPFIFLSLAGVLLILFTFIKTRTPIEEEAVNAEIQTILNKYASRMIILQAEPILPDKKELYLEGIDKLILLSEELQKPVFYSLDENGMITDRKFYIIDREFIYATKIVSSNSAKNAPDEDENTPKTNDGDIKTNDGTPKVVDEDDEIPL